MSKVLLVLEVGHASVAGAVYALQKAAEELPRQTLREATADDIPPALAVDVLRNVGMSIRSARDRIENRWFCTHNCGSCGCTTGQQHKAECAYYVPREASAIPPALAAKVLGLSAEDLMAGMTAQGDAAHLGFDGPLSARDAEQSTRINASISRFAEAHRRVREEATPPKTAWQTGEIG